MAHRIVVPRLGWTMEEGTFVQWLKRDGEPVKAGDMLFVLDGEKAAQEVEAMDSGTLRIPPDSPQPGQTVAVGDLLGYLAEAGEAMPWESPSVSVEIRAATAAPPSSPAASTPTLSKPHTLPRHGPAVSPRARRVAAELGVDWTQLAGSGRTGRIRERDVRAAAPAVQAVPSSDQGPVRIVPISPMRKVIAERMVAAAQTTAPVTLTTRADATNLVNLRNQFKTVAAADAVIPSYSDFILKLTALALREHPMLNANWTPDGIRMLEAIHIGIAVDTEAGLLVPVIRDVPALNLRQIAAVSRELIEQARSRQLKPEQMQGGTFTITNLGMYGVEAFTPIISLPQCAVLGLGRICREPAVLNDQIVPRDRMTLSLTFDHRVIDGGPAARFLDTLRRYVEQPGPWLML